MKKKVRFGKDEIKKRDVAHIILFRCSDTTESIVTGFARRGVRHWCWAFRRFQGDIGWASYNLRQLLHRIWPGGWELVAVEQWANGRMYLYSDPFEGNKLDEDNSGDMEIDFTQFFHLALEEDEFLAIGCSVHNRSTEVYLTNEDEYNHLDVSDTEATIEEVPTEEAA